MRPTGAIAAVPSPARSAGARPTVPALAVSVALHGVIAAAALWWPVSGAGVSVPRVTVEVAFRPEAVGDDATAASTAAVEPSTVDVEPEEVPELPLPLAAHEPQPMPHTPVDPAPPAIEPAPTLGELPPPPPPKPRERARIVPRPTPVERPVETTARAPTEPAPAVTETALAALPSPHPPAATPAQPASLPAANEIPASPPLITQARFRSPPTPPTYPRRAVDLGQEGEVVIRALVGPEGDSRDIRVFRSSGVAALDEAALRAVRRWAFEAAHINGRAIEAWVEVPVRFRLRTIL
jgi:periplasmic protein TonB